MKLSLLAFATKATTSLLNLKVCVAEGLFATFALTAVSLRPLTVLVPLEHSSEYLPHQVRAVMRRFGWETAQGLNRGVGILCTGVTSHSPAGF